MIISDTIKRLERTLTDAPFWLTGHYFVYSMLDNRYDENGCKSKKQKFVDSFEGIENLSFKNSIPFADEATITWLSTGNACVLRSKSSIIQTVVVAEE
ncbi:type VI secretion system domain-containing protein [Vibrio lentus]|nr:type VI secretion system domain-containing protein [Vibrio lentus]